MKKINLDLLTVDGNAFAIMGSFNKQAKKEGWTQEEIKKVIEEAKQGDYNHLIQIFIKYCK